MECRSAVNSTLLAFAVFALSFVFRPLGAAFWGSMGDKKGRKWSLSLSIFMMTGAAFLIGCLPSYETIGLLSPILLLCLRSSGFIMRKLGNSGVEAFSRLMGFLLVCIGVQFVINGVYEVVLEVQALLAA